MKKYILTSVFSGIVATLFSNSYADIKINLPEGSDIKKIDYFYAPISKLATAKSQAERGIEQKVAYVSDNCAIVEIPEIVGGCRFGFSFTANDFVDIFAAPNESIVIDVVSLAPFDYTVSGTELIDEMRKIEFISKPFEERRQTLMQAGNEDPEAMQKLYEEYQKALVQYINDNPESAGVSYALLSLNNDTFLEIQEKISSAARKSILYPLIEAKVVGVKHKMEVDRKQRAMEEEGIVAPEFTLKDLDGKNVSLSDFRQKWVILDFWGSWCIWCIKGFPELKDAYEKYSGQLEIIGIDCNENEEAWRAGVDKYELPWVNVYCPSDSNLIQEYEVQGFPTKVIVDPEGRIRNITTGHTPEFFNTLERLIGH